MNSVENVRVLKTVILYLGLNSGSHLSYNNYVRSNKKNSVRSTTEVRFDSYLIYSSIAITNKAIYLE